MLDFRDFGVSPNTGLDVTAGIATAIAAARAGGGGGNLHAPEGEYLISGPVGLDLSGPGQIRLHGDGPDRTLFTYTSLGIGILLGSTSAGICRKSGISGLYLRQGDGTLRANSPGNYGISTPNAGTGTGIYVKDCAVVGFRDHAINIAGPTGPTSIEDVEIYRCAGYGIVARTVSPGLVPQDLTITRGSIQYCYGGITLGTGCTSTAVYDTDIELGDSAHYPALDIGVGGGHSFHNVTASAGAPLTPSALIYCEGFGNTFTSGLFFAPPSADTFQFHGPNANHNTVIGGHHHGTSGYFARVHSGIHNAFLSPNLAPTYHPGTGLVYNTSGPANHTFAIGIPTT